MVGPTTYRQGWSQAVGQAMAEYSGEGPKIGKKIFSRKCWKSTKNTILKQKNFWIWMVGPTTYEPVMGWLDLTAYGHCLKDKHNNNKAQRPQNPKPNQNQPKTSSKPPKITPKTFNSKPPYISILKTSITRHLKTPLLVPFKTLMTKLESANEKFIDQKSRFFGQNFLEADFVLGAYRAPNQSFSKNDRYRFVELRLLFKMSIT